MQITDARQVDACYQALLARAQDHVGLFFAAVKTTGVFCIATCRARKPKPENVEFYSHFKGALDAGYRPCKICRPTENADEAPAAVAQAVDWIRRHPKERLGDAQLRQQGISPEALRRWFTRHHGMSFQAFQRMMRVNIALQELRQGRKTTAVALDSGYESLSGFGYMFKKFDRQCAQSEQCRDLDPSLHDRAGPDVCLRQRARCLPAGVC